MTTSHQAARPSLKRILVTGGCGFIGSNFIRHQLEKRNDIHILNFDKLTYAGNPENLKDLEKHPRYTFWKGDIADKRSVSEVVGGEKFDAIINFAAETHVDRSILDSSDFVKTNFLGTQVLLEAVRHYDVPLFIQISTDEVYGTLGAHGKFTEESPLAPNSPYAASKAAADLLVRSYHKTYGVPAIIVRSSNNYGPYQFPEKLIPLVITNALEDKHIPVYGDGLYVRDWIHVEDNVAAIDEILWKGRPGSIYNVGANCERTNIEIIKLILGKLGKPETLMKFVKDRPAHDRRYAIDFSKLTDELGWQPKIPFERGIEETVRWYQENTEWWKRIRTGEYLKYYKSQYGFTL